MDLESILESLLFASGEPQSIKELSSLINEKEAIIQEALLKLKDSYETEKRGLRLINNDNKWLLTTNPVALPFLNKLRKEVFEGDLSSAVAETLAIVSYRGSISRAEINEIRGVDSSYILHRLLLRELIERFPNPKRTNTFLYNISFKFMNHLGISSIKDLPNYEELHQKTFS